MVFAKQIFRGYCARSTHAGVGGSPHITRKHFIAVILKRVGALQCTQGIVYKRRSGMCFLIA